MSKDIKFRAWDKDKSKMFEVFGFDVNHVRAWLITDQAKIDYAIPPHRRDCILIQYTGLRDSKRTEEYTEGQDIYDGDILRYYSDGRMIVPDGNGGWKTVGDPHLEERTVVEWSSELGAYVVHGSMFLHEINEKSEVIGNIYEHPELMEGWK